MKMHTFMLLLGVLFLWVVPAQGTEHVIPDYESNRYELRLIALDNPGCRETGGEVAAIDNQMVWLRGPDGARPYKLSPAAFIYCNGRRSSWNALRPVTPDSFFEATALLDARGEVIALNGFYYGEECLINGWTRQGSLLVLDLESLGGGGRIVRTVSRYARLPQGSGWLAGDQIIFILYNSEGQIRAVYLPD